MAAKSRSKPSRATRSQDAVRVRWTRTNKIVLGVGLAAILIGYLFLSQGSISIAPLLLVAGYCVLIPLALLVGGGAEENGD